MFIDKAQVSIIAGDGGNGVVSFRHEIYVDKGGPDGGDGGNGGDVIVRGSQNQSSLANFRYSKELKAESGQAGSKRKKHGKSGQDLVIDLPVGTIVTNADGDILADLVQDDQRVIIAKGGKGGYGNAHFTSSTRQVPRIAEKGEPGGQFKAKFELKMLADVGLVGLPNAGKSTFLASVSNAKPDIADYPFTTLTPHLGVVDIDSDSFLMADIPGLIEGASAGKGLGDEFLRHVERTAALIHLIDAYQDDVAKVYAVIQNELASYQVDLSKRPQVVVLTKIEGLDEEMVNDKIEQLQKVVPKRTKIMAISSQSKEGVADLLRLVAKAVNKNRQKVIVEAEETGIPVIKLVDATPRWTATETKDGFMVRGSKIERFAARTDFENEHGIARLKDIMRKMGIMHELERRKISAGQQIHIAGRGTIEY